MVVRRGAPALGQKSEPAPVASAIRLLRHPTRSRLYALIQETWGTCETDLGELSGLGRNNVKYHLQRLLRAKLVQAWPLGSKMHFFPKDVHCGRLHRAIIHTQNKTRRQILEMIRIDPSLSWRAIGRMTGVTPRTVRWHIQGLEAHGLVDIESDGMYRRVRISPILNAALDGNLADMARSLRIQEDEPRPADPLALAAKGLRPPPSL